MFYAKSFALCKYLVNFMHMIAVFYAGDYSFLCILPLCDH